MTINRLIHLHFISLYLIGVIIFIVVIYRKLKNKKGPKELSREKFESTIIGKMVEIKDDMKTIYNIWPFVNNLKRVKIITKKIDENQQLAGYQLAVLENAFLTPLPSTQTSGAVLVFLGDKKAESANERAQKPIDHEKIKELVIDSAEKMSGDEFSATINSRCRTCAVKSSCPSQPQGRSVIDL